VRSCAMRNQSPAAAALRECGEDVDALGEAGGDGEAYIFLIFKIILYYDK